MFERNDRIEFHYPITTHVRYFTSQIAMRPRRLVVYQLRDLVAEPLTPIEYLNRPYVRRSRWLVRGTETGKDHPQQFYLGCSPEFRAPSQLRVALYRPDAIRPSKLLLRPFGPTVHDRDALRRWIHRHHDDDFDGLELRIFADDLYLHSNYEKPPF
ncbi:hypothetical protein [Novipirellula artificiosorum]|uniref:Uncharacterized protein n=1 Tax=Novipirellula artificiosorum TaxID=2528016 RepID=A0A5C6DMZ7_9BACT|nr:hypothetical protein [Novipirellula artificiosorum]TWU37227.1 hypothetical protein Poly41_33560 [Novipirellula artificiosorum]